MSRRPWNDWGEVYYHYVDRGHDRSDAAFRADEWEYRANKKASLEEIRARTLLARLDKGEEE